jgi:hypothetical protein
LLLFKKEKKVCDEKEEKNCAVHWLAKNLNAGQALNLRSKWANKNWLVLLNPTDAVSHKLSSFVL